MLKFEAGSRISGRVFKDEEIVLEGRGEIGLRCSDVVFDNCRIDARKADVNHVVLTYSDTRITNTTVLGGRVSCVCVQNSEVFISRLTVGQMKIFGAGTGYGLLLENCRGFVQNVRPNGRSLRHLVTVAGNSGPLIFHNIKVKTTFGFAALDLHGRGDVGVVGVNIVGRINVGNPVHKTGSKKVFLFESSGPVWLGLNSDYSSANSALKLVYEAKDTPKIDLADSPDISRSV